MGHFLDILCDVLLRDSMRPVKLVTVLVSILAAAGLFFGSAGDPAHDLDYLKSIMPTNYWIVLFLLLASSRLIGLVYHSSRRITYYSTSAVGIWLWSMLFASAAIMTPFEGMGILYIVIILIEVWILVRNIFDRDELKRYLDSTDGEVNE